MKRTIEITIVGDNFEIGPVGETPNRSVIVSFGSLESKSKGGGGGGGTQIQSDWNQTDNTKIDYIKNKPTIPSTASDVGAVPTTRTINGKALSSDISLDASDVGALPSSTVIPTVPTNVSAFTNDAGYLTSHQDISGKADKATTLAGYGITDAKIESGTITLGNNTITPLTSHQSLDNYVQKSQTAGLLKNDGTVDTTQYLTQHQDLSDYVQKSNTTGLLKNDGTVDTSTYLTQHQDISGKADKIEIVPKGQTNYGTSSQPYMIQPNKFYVWGELAELYLDLDTVSSQYLDEFMFQFESGSTPTLLDLPQNVGIIGTVEANKTYQCSIANNIAIIVGVS